MGHNQGQATKGEKKGNKTVPQGEMVLTLIEGAAHLKQPGVLRQCRASRKYQPNPGVHHCRRSSRVLPSNSTGVRAQHGWPLTNGRSQQIGRAAQLQKNLANELEVCHGHT